jgi:hypothetical protein
MSGLQVAIVVGVVVGVGAAAMVYALVPVQPDLGSVLSRLAPTSRRGPAAGAVVAGADSYTRMGVWAARVLPARLLGQVPAQDLAILRLSHEQFYGRKVFYAIVGVVAVPLVSATANVIGFPLPFMVPVVGTAALAVVMFRAPGSDVAKAAEVERLAARRSLSAYIELCALERISGASVPVSLASAASVGKSWLFERIAADLERARLHLRPAPSALHELGLELGMPELVGLADTMQAAGDETGAEAYDQLRARGAAVRSAVIAADLGEANKAEARLVLPGAVLAMTFLGLLIGAPLLRLVGT